MRAAGPYSVVALAALAATLAAPLLPRAPFAAYAGSLPPPVAMALVAGGGAWAVHRLARVGWAPDTWPHRTGAWGPRLARYAAAGALFALPMIALDAAMPFPRDINAPLPEALAFYPAIGLAAETAFHLVPFAVLSLALPARPALAAVACALVEPAFQVMAGGVLDPRAAIMAAILFAFGLVQLSALRRHGFVAAFALRMGYYLVWHLGWGAARLPLLFAA